MLYPKDGFSGVQVGLEPETEFWGENFGMQDGVVVTAAFKQKGSGFARRSYEK